MLRHNRIDRKHRIILAILAGILVVSAIGIAISQHTYHRNLAALLDLQAQNQADTIFRSDSQQKRLVEYFDGLAYTYRALLYPSTLSNDRMLAHYLLGRAHADMGDAPTAIHDYLEAAGCADTTSANCDYTILSRVYGQMAEVFHEQAMPYQSLDANEKFIKYELLLEDTINALIGEEFKIRPLFYLRDTTSLLAITEDVSHRFLECGRPDKAARTLVTSADIYLAQGDYAKAGHTLQEIHDKAGLFDEYGNPKPGCEALNLTQGNYLCATGNTDSAIVLFRAALASGLFEGAYRGLMNAHLQKHDADSVAKYARLYAETNDIVHENAMTSEIARIDAMYDYGLQKSLAETYLKHANSLKWGLIIALVIILVITVAMYRYKLQCSELQATAAAYMAEHAHGIVLMQQLDELKCTNNEETKRRDEMILSLKEQMDDIKQKYALLRGKDKAYTFYTLPIADRLTKAARVGLVTEVTDAEWDELRTAFREAFPRLVCHIESRSRSLTPNQWKILILYELGVPSGMMSVVTSLSPSRITGVKGQINHTLFDEDGASTLSYNLNRALFVPHSVGI